MDNKIFKYGNHVINNDNDGYIYSFNCTDSTDFGSHLHKCFEFIHIIQGQLIYNVEGSEYLLNEGDIIMTKPDEFHSFTFPENCTYQREFLHIYPGFICDYPNLLKSLNERKSGYFNRIPAGLVKKHGLDYIFSSISSYCENPLPETDFMVFTYSLQLIIKILRILCDEKPEQQNIISNTKSSAICRYIDAHFQEDIGLNDIACTFFMSPSYTSRLFKRETGMTVKSYINMRRITKAKSFIMQGHKMTSIFPECGFSDYSTFYRAFVKYVGMTPDEFRHSQIKN